jgi:DNA-binding MarR family transcriptional regulator
MAQAKVLYVVIGAESLRMSELAARLGISMSTASGAVERLVEIGLIERRADPADRRQVIVAATPAGIDVLQRMRELNTRQMRALLQRMSGPDLAVIERSIEIFAAAAEAAAAPSTATPPATSATTPATDQPAEREPS